MRGLSGKGAALSKAIAERDAAREALRIASEASQRGRELLQAAEDKLRSFGDVDGAILTHRARSFKSAAQGGSKPSLALPDDLLKRERGRDEAASAVAAAQAATESLAADAARSEKALRQAERQVSERAVEILVAEGIDVAATLRAAWQDVWEKLDALNALAGASVLAPVRLPPDVIKLLQTLSAFDHRQFAGGHNAALSQAREHWRNRHAELCRDADSEMPEDDAAKQAA